ncbi:Uncharacterized protein APZ42_018332 [Daphnia magna]|uniref:Uncharacterized protein n=1 Tax=Daphnia magna TaxID=35525 RepID=A0A164Z4B9_9CRUS|nr:Uncharacterized protein APZ42_018332 [Daphnia magna]
MYTSFVSFSSTTCSHGKLIETLDGNVFWHHGVLSFRAAHPKVHRFPSLRMFFFSPFSFTSVVSC